MKICISAAPDFIRVSVGVLEGVADASDALFDGWGTGARRVSDA
jgi:hypothetical protein